MARRGARTPVAVTVHDSALANETIPRADAASRRRYELQVGGEVAGMITYDLQGERIELIHTEVDPRFEGRGLASQLVQFAMDDARRRKLNVVPSCSYVRKWLERHDGYADLVAQR